MFGLQMQVYPWIGCESLLAEADIDPVDQVVHTCPAFTRLQITHHSIN